jgi:tetratricopeptide (TPR) repeat protein
MNNQFKYSDKIMAYLNHLLPPEEDALFEQEMKDNPAFYEEVQLQKMELLTMKMLQEDRLKAKMKEWDKDIQEDSQKPDNVIPIRKPISRRIIQRWSAAAGILIVIVVALQLVSNHRFSDPQIAQRLFNESSYTVRGEGYTVRGKDSVPQELAEALQKIQNKEYTEAVSILNNLKNTEYTELILLLKGESYFKSNQFDQAIETYQSIIDQTEIAILREEAEYYLLLTHLLAGNEAEANRLTNDILSNPNHSFYPYVQKLQEERDKNFLPINVF